MRHGARRSSGKQLLKSLEIPDPFDIHVLCERIGRRHGRPVRLVPLRFPPDGPGGLLACAREADYIFFDVQAAPAHRDHIIAHELGHLLLGHGRPDPLLAEAGTADASEVLLAHMFARTHYDQPDERAAEEFATELLRRVSVWGGEQAPAALPAPSAGLVRRLESSLESGKRHS